MGFDNALAESKFVFCIAKDRRLFLFKGYGVDLGRINGVDGI